MPHWVRDAGVWKEVQKMWVRDAGLWKEVQNAWVRDAAAWKEFFANASVDITDPISMNVNGAAGIPEFITLDSNGTISGSSNGVQWYLPTTVNIGDDFAALLTKSTGSDPASGVLNTWQNIGLGSASYGWVEGQSFTGTLSIRDVATETLQGTASVSVTIT